MGSKIDRKSMPKSKPEQSRKRKKKTTSSRRGRRKGRGRQYPPASACRWRWRLNVHRIILNLNLNLASSFSFSGPATAAKVDHVSDSGSFFASNFQLRSLLRIFIDLGFILAPILTSKIDLGALLFQLRFSIKFLSIFGITFGAILVPKASLGGTRNRKGDSSKTYVLLKQNLTF